MPHRPKRILFLTYGFSVGGAETLFVNLINKLDRTKLDPVLVSLAPPATLEGKLNPDLNVVRFPRRSMYDFRFAGDVASLITNKDIDTVLALGFASYLFVKAALLKIKPRPRVYYSVHLTKPRTLRDFLSIMMYARMLSHTDKLVPVCESQKEYLSRTYRIKQESFSPTIYNGVDTAQWTLPPASFDAATERAKLGIHKDATVILSVASFRREKRHDIMIRSFSHLKSATAARPIYLVFVGGGDARAQSKMKVLATRLGVVDRVIFVGAKQDMRPYYWLSDLFTLASTSETFSIAALEAMSTGLPCVLTDVGGANEMVTEGRNGILVRPGSVDALRDGWEVCIGRLPLLQRATVRDFSIPRFSISACIRHYEELLLNHDFASKESSTQPVNDNAETQTSRPNM